MIRLRNVTKTYQTKRRKTEALKNINLTFASQGLYFVVGESGGGKTTLLNLISLQDEVSSGTIDIDGKDVTHLKAKEKAIFRNHYFGIVFQNINLIPEFSVFENMVMGLRLQKKEINEEEIKEVMKRLGLPEDILKEKIYHLSGGQRQRVAIARALLKDSKVMICDEPTGSLDEENAEGILKILKEISRERLVIVVSHDKVLSEKYGDQILQIEEGRIKKETIKTELVSSSEMEKTEMNRPPRLPFRFMVRMAAESFRRGMVRLIFTMISFVLGIAMLMVAISMYVFDITEATKSLIQSENITYFGLQKENAKTHSPISFDSKELEYINEVYPDQYIVAQKSEDLSTSFILNCKEEISPYRTWTENVCSITDEQIGRYRFSLFGRLPQNHSAEDEYEIVLTKYFCYALGWVEEDEMDQEEVFQKIIEEKDYNIRIFRGSVRERIVPFHIVGIIDTNYRFFEKVSQRNQDEQENEMHTCCFVCPETFDELMEVSIAERHIFKKEYSKVYVLSQKNNFFKVDRLKKYFPDSSVMLSAGSNIDYVIEQSWQIKAIGDICLAITVILLIFNVFALVGYMNCAMEINLKKMKILRSLGITQWDVNHIFSIQDFFLTCASIIPAILLQIIAKVIIDSYLNGLYETSARYFRTSWWGAMLSFVVFFLLTVGISSLMNAYKTRENELLYNEI